MEQWFKACDIDLASHRLLSDDLENWESFHHVGEEIERVERATETVVFGQMEEVRDEMQEKRE